ncbi:Uncharacterised protein [Shewanella baltica]|nr:Uncharacterised protein [Shewanella baltica]
MSIWLDSSSHQTSSHFCNNVFNLYSLFVVTETGDLLVATYISV